MAKLHLLAFLASFTRNRNAFTPNEHASIAGTSVALWAFMYPTSVIEGGPL